MTYLSGLSIRKTMTNLNDFIAVIIISPILMLVIIFTLRGFYSMFKGLK